MKQALTHLPLRSWSLDSRTSSVLIHFPSRRRQHFPRRLAISSELTRMYPREIVALRNYLSPKLKGRTISDPHHEVSLTTCLQTTCLAGRVPELSGRSVLLAASGQVLSALAMVEIDGVARRMLLCPPDVNPDH